MTKKRMRKSNSDSDDFSDHGIPRISRNGREGPNYNEEDMTMQFSDSDVAEWEYVNESQHRKLLVIKSVCLADVYL